MTDDLTIAWEHAAYCEKRCHANVMREQQFSPTALIISVGEPLPTGQVTWNDAAEALARARKAVRDG